MEFFKKIITTLICLLLATAEAICQEWIHVSETYNGTYYVDYSTIIRNEQMVIMSHMVDYPRRQVSANGLPFKSELLQVEYDCKKPEQRILEHLTMSGRKGSGKLVFPRRWKSSGSRVVAGTLDETLWRIACDVVESDNIITDYNLANPLRENE